MYRVLFLTVSPNFQYQNEKRVAANQRSFAEKISMKNISSLAWQVFVCFGIENKEER